MPGPSRPTRWWRRATGGAVLAAAATLLTSGCALVPPSAQDQASAGSSGSAANRTIDVVAAESVWGSLAQQLGGDRVRVRSIIANPDADPHDYEPTVADATAMARARLVIDNGIGYDSWAGKLADVDPVDGRTVLTVGDVVGVADGGNPHRWYSPTDVRTVIDRITAAYQALDPPAAPTFAARHETVLRTDLAEYFDLVAQLRASYEGTPVGASESIVSPLAEALGLRVLTPASFLSAVSEGSDPTAADKAAVDAQLAGRRIKVYLYNSQNATPDVQRQVDAARAAGIPVVTVTETLTPPGASFQQWQVTQLKALAAALARGTGA